MKNIFLVCIVSCCMAEFVHGMERPEAAAAAPEKAQALNNYQEIIAAHNRLNNQKLATQAQGFHAAAAAREKAQGQGWTIKDDLSLNLMDEKLMDVGNDLLKEYHISKENADGKIETYNALMKSRGLKSFEALEESNRAKMQYDHMNQKLELVHRFRSQLKKTSEEIKIVKAEDAFRKAQEDIQDYYEKKYTELEIGAHMKNYTTAEEIELTPEQLEQFSKVKLLYLYNIWLKMGGDTSGINLISLKNICSRYYEKNIIFAIEHGEGAKYLQLLRSPKKLVQAKAEFTESEEKRTAEDLIDARKRNDGTWDEAESYNRETHGLTRFLAELKKEDAEKKVYRQKLMEAGDALETAETKAENEQYQHIVNASELLKKSARELVKKPAILAMQEEEEPIIRPMQEEEPQHVKEMSQELQSVQDLLRQAQNTANVTPEQVNQMAKLFIYNTWLKMGGDTSGFSLAYTLDEFLDDYENIIASDFHDGKGAKYRQLLTSSLSEAKLTKVESAMQAAVANEAQAQSGDVHEAMKRSDLEKSFLAAAKPASAEAKPASAGLFSPRRIALGLAAAGAAVGILHWFKKT